MFNFGTIGAYKQARNNPRTKVQDDTLNGQVLKLDEVNGVATFPTADEVNNGDLYVAFNIVDKPEIRNTNDFKIEAGEYVRAFYLKDLAELPVQVGHKVLSGDYADIAVGDTLVPEADTGNWVKLDDGSEGEFAVSLEVIEKTTFADQGIVAKVNA